MTDASKAIQDVYTLFIQDDTISEEKNQNYPFCIKLQIHSHTLAVELSARLLETGILDPQKLLIRLEEEKSALDATDTINIIKDSPGIFNILEMDRIRFYHSSRNFY